MAPTGQESTIKSRKCKTRGEHFCLAAQRNSPQRLGAPRFAASVPQTDRGWRSRTGRIWPGCRRRARRAGGDTRFTIHVYLKVAESGVAFCAFFSRYEREHSKKLAVATARRAEDASQSGRFSQARGNKAAPAARDKGAALISDAFAEAQPEEPRVNLLSD